MLLKNKNAVIYGGGGAIGGAVARTFAREGAKVFLAGRTLAKLDAVAKDISAAGGVAETAEVDALDEQAVNKHADAVAARAGGIDPAQAPISVFVGIDWADAKHDICLLLPGEDDARHVQIENTPEALHDWVLKLIEEFGARGNIYVATEKARGALLYTLMQYPQLTLFPLNSKATGKLREALRAGGAKNDRWDCRLQAELVKHFHHLLPLWRPDDVLTRKLAALCEGRRKAVNTRLGQEIKAQLKASFPFALELLEGDCQSLLAADFLSKWPDLASLQRAGAATIRRFFYARNSRRMDRIELLLAKLKTTKPLTTDEAVIIPSASVLRTLAAQLRALLPFLAEYDKVLRSTFDQHPDAELFRSVPGAGEVMAPWLLTAFGSDRARFANAEAVSTFSGIAPVTKVHWACFAGRGPLRARAALFAR